MRSSDWRSDVCSSDLPVLRWVLERFRDSGREASDVCLLMPCAPLVEAEDLRGAYDAYARSGREIPLLAVVSFPYPVERALALDSEGVLRPKYPDSWHARSQDLAPAYHDAGQIGRDNVRTPVNN